MKPKCYFCKEADEHILINGPKRKENCAVLCLLETCRNGSQRQISGTEKQGLLLSVFIQEYHKIKEKIMMECVREVLHASANHMASIL